MSYHMTQASSWEARCSPPTLYSSGNRDPESWRCRPGSHCEWGYLQVWLGPGVLPEATSDRPTLRGPIREVGGSRENRPGEEEGHAGEQQRAVISGQGLPGLCRAVPLTSASAVAPSDPQPHSCLWTFTARSPRPRIPVFSHIYENEPQRLRLEIHRLNPVPMYHFFSPCTVLKCGSVYRAASPRRWLTSFGKEGSLAPESHSPFRPPPETRHIQVATVSTISVTSPTSKAASPCCSPSLYYFSCGWEVYLWSRISIKRRNTK